ncbi:hypothetical protein SNEBB_004332 [Seison nebaliae]|nr:hypothetical protein SNEBB_004332 [Seison nebaliae]
MICFRIWLSNLGDVKRRSVKFDKNITVEEACELIRQRLPEAKSLSTATEDVERYGMFIPRDLNEKRSGGVWMDMKKRLIDYESLLTEKNSNENSLKVVEYCDRIMAYQIQYGDSMDIQLLDSGERVDGIIFEICQRLQLANYEEYSLIHELNDKDKQFTLTMRRQQPTFGSTINTTQMNNQMNVENETNDKSRTLDWLPATLRRSERNKKKMEQIKMKFDVADDVLWLNHSMSLRAQGVCENDCLILRRKYYFSDRNIDQNDPKQLQLLYDECVRGILNGRLAVSVDEAVRLAGLQLYVEFGSSKNSAFHSKVKQMSNLTQFFQPYLPLEYQKMKNIERILMQQYQKIAMEMEMKNSATTNNQLRSNSSILPSNDDESENDNISLPSVSSQNTTGSNTVRRVLSIASLKETKITEAKFEYCKYCRSLKTYGITFFVVKEKMQKKSRLVTRLFGIGRKAVYRMDIRSKEFVCIWPLHYVKRWAVSPNTFSLDLGDHEKDFYRIQTKEGEQIAQLISGYVDILMKMKRLRDKTLYSAHISLEKEEKMVNHQNLSDDDNLSLTTTSNTNTIKSVEYEIHQIPEENGEKAQLVHFNHQLPSPGSSTDQELIQNNTTNQFSDYEMSDDNTTCTSEMSDTLQHEGHCTIVWRSNRQQENDDNFRRQSIAGSQVLLYSIRQTKSIIEESIRKLEDNLSINNERRRSHKNIVNQSNMEPEKENFVKNRLVVNRIDTQRQLITSKLSAMITAIARIIRLVLGTEKSKMKFNENSDKESDVVDQIRNSLEEISDESIGVHGRNGGETDDDLMKRNKLIDMNEMNLTIGTIGTNLPEFFENISQLIELKDMNDSLHNSHIDENVKENENEILLNSAQNLCESFNNLLDLIRPINGLAENDGGDSFQNNLNENNEFLIEAQMKRPELYDVIGRIGDISICLMDELDGMKSDKQSNSIINSTSMNIREEEKEEIIENNDNDQMNRLLRRNQNETELENEHMNFEEFNELSIRIVSSTTKVAAISRSLAKSFEMINIQSMNITDLSDGNVEQEDDKNNIIIATTKLALSISQFMASLKVLFSILSLSSACQEQLIECIESVFVNSHRLILIICKTTLKLKKEIIQQNLDGNVEFQVVERNCSDLFDETYIIHENLEEILDRLSKTISSFINYHQQFRQKRNKVEILYKEYRSLIIDNYNENPSNSTVISRKMVDNTSTMGKKSQLNILEILFLLKEHDVALKAKRIEYVEKKMNNEEFSLTSFFNEQEQPMKETLLTLEMMLDAIRDNPMIDIDYYENDIRKLINIVFPLIDKLSMNNENELTLNEEDRDKLFYNYLNRMEILESLYFMALRRFIWTQLQMFCKQTADLAVQYVSNIMHINEYVQMITDEQNNDSKRNNDNIINLPNKNSSTTSSTETLKNYEASSPIERQTGSKLPIEKLVEQFLLPLIECSKMITDTIPNLVEILRESIILRKRESSDQTDKSSILSTSLQLLHLTSEFNEECRQLIDLTQINFPSIVEIIGERRFDNNDQFQQINSIQLQIQHIANSLQSTNNDMFNWISISSHLLQIQQNYQIKLNSFNNGTETNAVLSKSSFFHIICDAAKVLIRLREIDLNIIEGELVLLSGRNDNNKLIEMKSLHQHNSLLSSSILSYSSISLINEDESILNNNKNCDEISILQYVLEWERIVMRKLEDVEISLEVEYSNIFHNFEQIKSSIIDLRQLQYKLNEVNENGEMNEQNENIINFSSKITLLIKNLMKLMTVIRRLIQLHIKYSLIFQQNFNENLFSRFLFEFTQQQSKGELSNEMTSQRFYRIITRMIYGRTFVVDGEMLHKFLINGLSHLLYTIQTFLVSMTTNEITFDDIFLLQAFVNCIMMSPYFNKIYQFIETVSHHPTNQSTFIPDQYDNLIKLKFDLNEIDKHTTNEIIGEDEEDEMKLERNSKYFSYIDVVVLTQAFRRSTEKVVSTLRNGGVVSFLRLMSMYIHEFYEVMMALQLSVREIDRQLELYEEEKEVNENRINSLLSMMGKCERIEDNFRLSFSQFLSNAQLCMNMHQLNYDMSFYSTLQYLSDMNEDEINQRLFDYSSIDQVIHNLGAFARNSIKSMQTVFKLYTILYRCIDDQSQQTQPKENNGIGLHTSIEYQENKNDKVHSISTENGNLTENKLSSENIEDVSNLLKINEKNIESSFNELSLQQKSQQQHHQQQYLKSISGFNYYRNKTTLSTVEEEPATFDFDEENYEDNGQNEKEKRMSNVRMKGVQLVPNGTEELNEILRHRKRMIGGDFDDENDEGKLGEENFSSNSNPIEISNIIDEEQLTKILEERQLDRNEVNQSYSVVVALSETVSWINDRTNCRHSYRNQLDDQTVNSFNDILMRLMDIKTLITDNDALNEMMNGSFNDLMINSSQHFINYLQRAQKIPSDDSYNGNRIMDFSNILHFFQPKSDADNDSFVLPDIQSKTLLSIIHLKQSANYSYYTCLKTMSIANTLVAQFMEYIRQNANSLNDNKEQCLFSLNFIGCTFEQIVLNGLIASFIIALSQPASTPPISPVVHRKHFHMLFYSIRHSIQTIIDHSENNEMNKNESSENKREEEEAYQRIKLLMPQLIKMCQFAAHKCLNSNSYAFETIMNCMERNDESELLSIANSAKNTDELLRLFIHYLPDSSDSDDEHDDQDDDRTTSKTPNEIEENEKRKSFQKKVYEFCDCLDIDDLLHRLDQQEHHHCTTNQMNQSSIINRNLNMRNESVLNNLPSQLTQVTQSSSDSLSRALLGREFLIFATKLTGNSRILYDEQTTNDSESRREILKNLLNVINEIEREITKHPACQTSSKMTIAPQARLISRPLVDLSRTIIDIGIRLIKNAYYLSNTKTGEMEKLWKLFSKDSQLLCYSMNELFQSMSNSMPGLLNCEQSINLIDKGLDELDIINKEFNDCSSLFLQCQLKNQIDKLKYSEKKFNHSIPYQGNAEAILTLAKDLIWLSSIAYIASTRSPILLPRCIAKIGRVTWGISSAISNCVQSIIHSVDLMKLIHENGNNRSLLLSILMATRHLSNQSKQFIRIIKDSSKKIRFLNSQVTRNGTNEEIEIAKEVIRRECKLFYNSISSILIVLRHLNELIDCQNSVE